MRFNAFLFAVIEKYKHMNEQGKILPQALDLEEAILGAMIVEMASIIEVMDTLQPKFFYKEANQIIYKELIELQNKGGAIDMLILVNSLKRKGNLERVGGAYYISNLTSRVASAVNIAEHSKIVAQMYLRRSVIEHGQKVIQRAYDETIDTFQLVDETIEDFNKSTLVVQSNNIQLPEKLIKEMLVTIEKLQNSKDELIGIPTGNSQLDKITGGWQVGLHVIAGRPAMGKTAFVLMVAKSAAMVNDEPTMIFSLEMPALQLNTRIVSMETEIDSKLLRKDAKKLDVEYLHKRLGENKHLYSSNLMIDDSSVLTINQLKSRAKKVNLERRANNQKPLGLIIVDYLQLMSGTSTLREQEIGEISRGLKVLSKELGIPVIALSQLSRKVEDRPGKKPQLSDLRESGSIEQDADSVSFLYRPEYYGITEDEEGNNTVGSAFLIIAKNREGDIGAIKMKFLGRYTKFTNWDEDAIVIDDKKDKDLPF